MSSESPSANSRTYRVAGKPVKLTWTREDDLRHAYYHTVSVEHLEAGLDAQGNVTAIWARLNSTDLLTQATHQPAESFCRACLTGHYPTEIPADMRLSKLRFEAQPVEAG